MTYFMHLFLIDYLSSQFLFIMTNSMLIEAYKSSDACIDTLARCMQHNLPKLEEVLKNFLT